MRALGNCEIPVMGHLGLAPQSVNAMGGFKVQGRNADDALHLLTMRTSYSRPGALLLSSKASWPRSPRERPNL